MNSFVNVQVRVLAGQAMAQLAALERRVKGLEGGFGRAGASAFGFGASLDTSRLSAFGSRIQWVGRQLEYNFTLPILAASAVSIKFALDNERAFKRIEKVYGDATTGAETYSNELASLQENFKALSSAYGVNQTEVLNVAAAWAAAGASGLALAKSVDLTMQTMILGELEAIEATEALIAIQAQYGQNVGELTKTIAVLNAVENQTGIAMRGLVEGFSRAAGVARDAGVDVRHLAAMLAALTPAAGSAAQAGNAIKTILSRLVAPTEETVGLLREMNIETSDLAWKSADATGKLAILARTFNELDVAQKNVVSSVIASRWQVNKFSILMRELTNENGYYQKALEATNDEQAVFNQLSRELQVVLSSNPRRLEILWATIQNAAADIIQPMIPMLLWLTAQIAKLVTAFSELNPSVQKLIVVGLVLLATVGTIVRIMGAFVLLFAQLSIAVRFAIAPLLLFARALWAIAGTPIIGFFAALGRAMTVGIIAGINAATSVVVAFGAFMSRQILLIAAQIGIGFGLGMRALPAIISGILIHIITMWKIFMYGLQTVMIAAAAAMGRAWRAFLLGLAAIHKAWAALMAINWRTVFMLMLAATVNFFKIVAMLFTRGIAMLRAAGFAMAAALASPWVALGAVVVGLILAFWNELRAIWKAIVEGTIQAWNTLPQGVANALRAVVNVVYKAAMAVYEAMSWMNPWARHSPSLVDNVRTGVAEIKKQYSTIDRISEIFRNAGMGMREFGKIIEKIKRTAQLQDIANQRNDISGIASDSIPLFDKLVKVLFPLRDLLQEIADKVNKQQAVVDKWKQKLDAANAALEEQKDKLQQLQSVADKYKEQLNAAQSELDRFANAPIKGMKAMEDAIFANEMKQKKLRLEMLKMEEAVGPLDKLKSKIDAINGEMELLSGERNALRAAGAGSEILSQYDNEIKKLEEQKGVIEDQIKPIQDIADQLEKLGREAEILDLEKSLKFDPLKRQIDDLINSMEEMPFEKILAGVIANKEKVDDLTEAYDKANAAVEAQQGVVDKLAAARDAIQASYDLESAKLQQLQDEYSQVESKIRDIETALNDMAGAARSAAQAARDAAGGSDRTSPGVGNFRDAAGGNFPDPGGFAQIGREGGLGDQSAMIDEFTRDMQQQTKDLFGMFNFLDPIKKAWNTAWGWVKKNIGGPIGDVGSSIGSKIGELNPFGGMGSWLDVVKDLGQGVWDAMQMVWEVIGPEVIDIGKQAWAGLKDAFADIQPEIEKFRDLIGPAGEALKNIWTVLKPVLAVVLGLILLVIKALLGAIAGAIGPFIRAIGDLITGIIKIIRGIIQVVVGVFTGDWDKAWQGVLDIFSGIWQAIWGVLKNFGNMIWGAIKGLVLAIADFFMWLWDELVGNSIIPDMVNAIIDWFKKLWDKCVEFVKNLARDVAAKWNELWDKVKAKLDEAKTWTTTKIDELKNAATSKIESLKNDIKSKWDWLWDQVKSKIDWAKGQVGDAVGAVKSIFDGLKNKWDDIVDDLGKLVDTMVSKFNGIKNRLSFSGMFDGIKNAFRSALNWIIGKWNNLSFPGISVAGQQLTPSFGTPNIPMLAKGARITRATLAMIGEGRSGFPEYVIPTDPTHRQRALALVSRLMSELGHQIPGGNLGRGTLPNYRAPEMSTMPVKTETHLHFHGDLQFPNIRNEDDADRFISHLESLAGGVS